MDSSFSQHIKKLQISERLSLRLTDECLDLKHIPNIQKQKHDILDINYLIREKKRKQRSEHNTKKQPLHSSQEGIVPFNPMACSSLGAILTNNNEEENMIPQTLIETSETQLIIGMDKSLAERSLLASNLIQENSTKNKQMNFRHEKSQILIEVDSQQKKSQKITKKKREQTITKSKRIHNKNEFGNKICRYCLDVDNPRMRVIQPCKCQRSQQYIHQDCLKKQIIRDHGNRVKDSLCFSCKYKYKMKLQSVRSYMPKLGWSRSVDKVPLISLIIFFLVLTVMDALLLQQYQQISQTQVNNNQQKFLEQPVTLMCFICFCLLIQVSVILCIFLILKNICYVEKIYQWDILDYDPSRVNDKELVTIPSFLNQNIEIKDGKIMIQNSPEQQIVERPDLQQGKELKHQQSMRKKKKIHNFDMTPFSANYQIPCETNQDFYKKIRSKKTHNSLWIDASKIKAQSDQKNQIPTIYDQLQLQKMDEQFSSPAEPEEPPLSQQKITIKKSKLFNSVHVQKTYVDDPY